MLESTGGVYILPSSIMKMFSPGPSATLPSLSSTIASVYPFDFASSDAMMELTYAPVIFAVVGICEEWCFRHDETETSTPFFIASSPK